MEKKPSTDSDDQNESVTSSNSIPKDDRQPEDPTGSSAPQKKSARTLPGEESQNATPPTESASAASAVSSDGSAAPTSTQIPASQELTKNPAAVSLGRLGGLKGGKARAEALTKRERSEAARKAARARWRKKEQSN